MREAAGGRRRRRKLRRERSLCGVKKEAGGGR